MSTEPASIAILLGTFNGVAFIDEQIESIANQTGDHVDSIDLYVSDDGSTDGTIERLTDWQHRWTCGEFILMKGPQAGFAENYRHLLRQTPHTYSSYAFADQDDVWDTDKLEVALNQLALTPNQPSLYCGRTRCTDRSRKVLGFSPLFKRPPDFRNALCQSIGGGNTIVMNPQSFALLVDSAHRTGFVSHDWWAYILISGAGGTVFYDPVPHLDYRQHGGNVQGSNNGLSARLSRLRSLLSGRLRNWTDQNLQSLHACRDLLTPQAQNLIDQVTGLRSQSWPVRMSEFQKSGLYRQSTLDNFALKLAVSLKLF